MIDWGSIVAQALVIGLKQIVLVSVQTFTYSKRSHDGSSVVCALCGMVC